VRRLPRRVPGPREPIVDLLSERSGCVGFRGAFCRDGQKECREVGGVRPVASRWTSCESPRLRTIRAIPGYFAAVSVSRSVSSNGINPSPTKRRSTRSEVSSENAASPAPDLIVEFVLCRLPLDVRLDERENGASDFASRYSSCGAESPDG
jgi:hypothetical protein